MLRTMTKRLAPVGIPAVEAVKQIETAQPGLSGWMVQAAGTGGVTADGMKKTFTFKDFHQAWAFMNGCVDFINVTDHHPEWFNVYNRVEVRLSTHDVKPAGGISAKDFALASEMERVAATIAKK